MNLGKKLGLDYETVEERYSLPQFKHSFASWEYESIDAHGDTFHTQGLLQTVKLSKMTCFLLQDNIDPVEASKYWDEAKSQQTGAYQAMIYIYAGAFGSM